MTSPIGPANIGEQRKTRSQLEIAGLPTEPAGPAKVTLRQLAAFRRESLQAMEDAVERDMFPPHAWGLLGGGPIVDARQPVQRDYVQVGACAAGALALLGAGVAHAIVNKDPSALATIPLGVWTGMATLDLVGTGTHVATDQFIQRPHVPGERPTMATVGWIHHFDPSSVGRTHVVRYASDPAIAGAVIAGLALVGEGALLATGHGGGLGSFWASMLSGLAAACPLWLLGHRATHMGANGCGIDLARAVGLADTPVHHALHHRGDRKQNLPGEPPLRHNHPYHTGFGWLMPSHWLDKAGVFDMAVKLWSRVRGVAPDSYREYPSWAQYWEASVENKPVAMAKARLGALAIERDALVYDLEVANHTAATTTGEEAAEAVAYAKAVTQAIAKVDKATATITLEKEQLEAPRPA